MEYLFVGEISTQRNRVVWKISRFFRVLSHTYIIVNSPTFCIGNITTNLFARHISWLEVGFHQETKEANYKVRFGIIGKDFEFSRSVTLNSKDKEFFPLISSSQLSELRSSWVPEGNLTLFISIEDLEESDEAKISLITEKDIRKLQCDMEFLLKGNISDITVKIKDKEFECHRCILAARSPVFLAMVTHDTQESATGVINIKDAEPNIFSDFLEYVYTGSVENITLENVFGLYTISDKYQVIELKDSCAKRMLENISIANFFDTILTALRHSEEELLKACSKFFKKRWNSLEIIRMSNWQEFMVENPALCRKLLVELLESKKSLKTVPVNDIFQAFS